jgi:hypothetical protein
MKTKQIAFFIMLLSILLAPGCNKDNDDDPTSNASSYFKAKVNGKTIISEYVSGGSLLDILQIVPLDDSDNPLLVFTISHYNGVGNCNINQDIRIQYNGNLYLGKEGSIGKIEITIDNQLAPEGEIATKGNFNCKLYNILEETDELEIADAEFFIKN